MKTLSDDDALKLSYEYEEVANALGALKRVPELSDADWARLDEAEGHLRDQAAILTTWAVGKTIDEAMTSVDDLQKAIRDASEATRRLAKLACNANQAACVLCVVGSLIGLAGTITSGNLSAIGNAVASVGKNTRDLVRAS